MRRLYYIVALLMLVPAVVQAQVEKQVEVSKDYAPTVSTAQKLALVPDMTDTVMMRPEVDYTITPYTFETSLITDRFRPATITYWDYQSSRPLYAHVAMGVPLASEADLYVATHNKDRGYAMAYLNHWGDYRSRHNLLGETVKKNTSEMDSRIGGRAGVFVGPRLLEVDVAADHRLRHRYPSTGEAISFGRGGGTVRFGDDFTDLSRWNFNIEAGGSYFMDNVLDDNFNEASLAGSVALGKLIADRHTLRLTASYDGVFGGKALSQYRNNIFAVGARYGFETKRFELMVGADYYYDKVAQSTDLPHHLLPYLRVALKSVSEGFVPFIEVDGEVRRNNYENLIYANPYMRVSGATAEALSKQANEVLYNGRAGFGGNVGGGVFAYDLSAELSIANNHLYWYSDGADYLFTDAYQHSLRLDGNFVVRPSGAFSVEARAGVFVWENYDGYYSNRPTFNAGATLRYDSRKIRAGVSLDYASAIKWMTLDKEAGHRGEPQFTYTRTNGTLLLGAEFEWQVKDRLIIYVEGRNLTGSKVYEWLNYYRSTPEGMLGVKFSL